MQRDTIIPATISSNAKLYEPTSVLTGPGLGQEFYVARRLGRLSKFKTHICHPLMNIYGESTIDAYTRSNVFTLTATRPFGVTKLIGWGDAPGEFLIYRNDQVVGGGRTSDAQRVVQLDYSVSPIMFSPQDTIALKVEHGSMGLRLMRANIIGKYF